MSNLMKIFGLEVRLGNTQIDLKKVDDLFLKTTQSVRKAKADWIAYSEALNSLKGHELILQFMKEYEAKAKTTTVARRAMTAEEKVAARQSRESAKMAEMQVLAEKSRTGSIRQLEAEVSKLTILWKALSREEQQMELAKIHEERQNAIVNAIREDTKQQIEAINRRIDTLKVVVLDRDITEAQKNTKKIKVRSTW